MSENPFTVLGTAPTLDAAVVKRAWFAALQRHPPHSDPEGFRRIRDAYEALTGPGRLEVAWANAPVDVDAELAAFAVRFDAGLAKAREAGARAAAVDACARRLIDTFSRLSLAEARARARITQTQTQT